MSQQTISSAFSHIKWAVIRAAQYVDVVTSLQRAKVEPHGTVISNKQPAGFPRTAQFEGFTHGAFHEYPRAPAEGGASHIKSMPQRSSMGANLRLGARLPSFGQFLVTTGVEGNIVTSDHVREPGNFAE